MGWVGLTPTCAAVPLVDGGMVSSAGVNQSAFVRKTDSLGDVTTSPVVIVRSAVPLAKVRLVLPGAPRLITVTERGTGCQLSASASGAPSTPIGNCDIDGNTVVWKWYRFSSTNKELAKSLKEFDAIVGDLTVAVWDQGNHSVSVPVVKSAETPGLPSGVTSPPRESDPVAASSAKRIERAIKKARTALASEAATYMKSRQDKIDEFDAQSDERRKQRNREKRHEELHGYDNRDGPDYGLGDGRNSERFDQRLADPKGGEKEARAKFDPGPKWSDLLRLERDTERRRSSIAGNQTLVQAGGSLDRPEVAKFIKELRTKMCDARIQSLLQIIESDLAGQ